MNVASIILQMSTPDPELGKFEKQNLIIWEYRNKMISVFFNMNKVSVLFLRKKKFVKTLALPKLVEYLFDCKLKLGFSIHLLVSLIF